MLHRRIHAAITDITSYHYHAPVGASIVCTDNAKRLNEYRVAIHKIAKKPLYGYGTGVLDNNPRPIADIPCIWSGIENYYLTVFYELGFIGLTIFILMLCAQYNLIKFCDHYVQVKVRCIFLAVLVGSMTFPYLSNGGALVLLFTSCSITVGAYVDAQVAARND